MTKQESPLLVRLTRPRDPVAHSRAGMRPAAARAVHYHVEEVEDEAAGLTEPARARASALRRAYPGRGRD